MGTEVRRRGKPHVAVVDPGFHAPTLQLLISLIPNEEEVDLVSMLNEKDHNPAFDPLDLHAPVEFDTIVMLTGANIDKWHQAGLFGQKAGHAQIRGGRSLYEHIMKHWDALEDESLKQYLEQYVFVPQKKPQDVQRLANVLASHLKVLPEPRGKELDIVMYGESANNAAQRGPQLQNQNLSTLLRQVRYFLQSFFHSSCHNPSLSPCLHSPI